MPFGQLYSTGEPYAPWPMESFWSPDGRTLLVGTSVWMAHLTAFDLIAQRSRPITSGLSNDLSQALCSR